MTFETESWHSDTWTTLVKHKSHSLRLNIQLPLSAWPSTTGTNTINYHCQFQRDTIFSRAEIMITSWKYYQNGAANAHPRNHMLEKQNFFRLKVVAMPRLLPDVGQRSARLLASVFRPRFRGSRSASTRFQPGWRPRWTDWGWKADWLRIASSRDQSNFTAKLPLCSVPYFELHPSLSRFFSLLHSFIH